MLGKPLKLCGPCGLYAESFHSLFLGENDEVIVVWTCEKCDIIHYVVVEQKPQTFLLPKPVFSYEDKIFLKKMNTYVSEMP